MPVTFPLNGSFSPISLSWGNREAMIQAHLQSWPWQSQSPIYKVDWKQNPFNYELGSCHCFCLCFSAGILHISIAFFAHAFQLHTEKKGRHTRAHTRKTSYLCVLFCNDIFYKGMYSLSFPLAGNLIQIIARPVDITQWLLSRIPN